MDAHENILKYSQELLEEYPGKYIAIVRNKVVAQWLCIKKLIINS